MNEYILTATQRNSGQLKQFVFASQEQGLKAWQLLTDPELIEGEAIFFEHQCGKTWMVREDYTDVSFGSATAAFASITWFTENNLRAQHYGQVNAQNNTLARAVPLIKQS